MAQRTFNVLSSTQRSFGEDGDSDFGGWAIRSGAATLDRRLDLGFSYKYIPNDYPLTFRGNTLYVKPSSSASIVLESDFFTVAPGVITFLVLYWPLTQLPLGELLRLR